jgi:cell division protein FtsI (penicillin-binding protein 3)
MMQKIAKNQWKPISDINEKEPQDGYDIISTIDVYIQDIAHHALLKQLRAFNADHGCVVVMETKTGNSSQKLIKGDLLITIIVSLL